MCIKYPGRDAEYIIGHMSLGFRRMARSGNGELKAINIELTIRPLKRKGKQRGPRTDSWVLQL